MPKASRRKGSPCKLLRYDGDRIYRLLTRDNRVIRSTNVEFVERGPFEHTYSDHFHTPRLEPSKADDTLDPSRAVSKARQLEESTCSHTPAPGGKTSEEHIDDCFFELELPATTTTRHKELPNPEHSSISEPTPSRIRVSTQATKEQASHRWMLLANLSKDSKAANELYEPTSYKETIEDSMQKM